MEKTFYQAGITTLPLSNVIPFFLHSHNMQFEMVESSQSLWQVSSFNRVCKKVDRSAKYCGASQKDYRCAEYCGAAQHIIKKCKMLEQCLETRNKIQSIKAPSTATPTLFYATILTSPTTTKQRTIYTWVLLKTNFSSFVIFFKVLELW